MRRTICLLFFGLSCLANAKPLTIRDYRQLIVPADPQISPNGKWIAFVKTVHDFKADQDLSTIVVANAVTGDSRSITPANQIATLPHWSADGTRIAYLVTNSAMIGQVWLVNTQGGAPKQLTHAPNGVQQFSWNPRGDMMAFVTPDDDPNQTALKAHDDLFEMGDDGYLTDSRPLPSHLWLIDLKTGFPKRLTKGQWSVLENPPPFAGNPSDPSWSPDGRKIAFARQANADNSDTDLTQVAIVDIESGEVKLSTDRSNYEYDPAFSPTSQTIAYLRPHDAPLGVMDVCTVDRSDSNAEWTDKLDRDVTAFTWMPDGKAVLAAGNDGLLTSIWMQRPDEPAVHLSLGGLSSGDMSAGGHDEIAFVGSTEVIAPEIYVMNGPNAKPHQLTHLNSAFHDYQFAKVAGFVSVADGGELSTNLLTYPLDYQPGQKYPLLVFIHGGPEAASTNQFLENEGGLLRQTMAAKGYFVYEPNYRGSDNEGQQHEHAIFQNPGEGPASDVLAGIQELENEGLIDSNRISVAGHSYGGYMTSWLISHDHRWKSAAVLDGAVDWTMEYCFSSDGNLAWTRDSLGGSPWDSATAGLYRTGSPVTYADQITTPTLIISGTADQTVPITESFELYHALKDRKVPVRFIAVPGAHHMPQDPVKYERFWEITEEWILSHDRE